MKDVFRVKGADGNTVIVPKGDWYINSKARCQRMVQNSLSSEARQVYARLELATMGFSQELAVVMEKGKRRALTLMDLRDETGFSKQNLRHAIAELEHAGLAQRRSVDGGPLKKGKVELYSWAVPRSAKEKNGSGRATTIPPWFPASWEPFRAIITRRRLRISIDEGVAARDYLEAGAEVARKYQLAEEGVARFLEGICARPKTAGIKRKELKGTIERNPSVGRQVGEARAPEADRPTDLPTPLPSLELIPDPRRDPAFAELVAVVESVAVPVIGESPSDQQYLEIYRRLGGAKAAHYRERLEAKKAQGKLNSVMVLGHLADDCCKSKDKWKPPQERAMAATAGGRKGFVESVTEAAAKRLAKWGHL